MTLDNTYSFLLHTIPEEEITKELLTGYPWKYTVKYVDASEDIDVASEESASYYGTSCDLFEEIEQRWEYDFKYIDGEILNITLSTPGLYAC